MVKSVVFWLLLGLCGSAIAVGDGGFLPKRDVNSDVEEYVWKEEAVKLPAYPKESDLIEFDVDVANTTFRYHIDPESLSFNLTEGVVRYTLVIRSNRGSENVSYEGIRCSASEYKIYAYGSRGTLHPTSNPKWRRVSTSGNTRYRGDLSKHYLCSQRYEAIDKETMLHNLRYGGATRDSMFDRY